MLRSPMTGDSKKRMSSRYLQASADAAKTKPGVPTANCLCDSLSAWRLTSRVLSFCWGWLASDGWPSKHFYRFQSCTSLKIAQLKGWLPSQQNPSNPSIHLWSVRTFLLSILWDFLARSYINTAHSAFNKQMKSHRVTRFSLKIVSIFGGFEANGDQEYSNQ